MQVRWNRYVAICVLASIPYCVAIACCENMQGINYCDSSVGRYVCRSGDYSSCYCTIHAIMDLQKFEGCCMWQGGVAKITEKGEVLCNNGTTSEICALQIPHEGVALY